MVKLDPELENLRTFLLLHYEEASVADFNGEYYTWLEEYIHNLGDELNELEAKNARLWELLRKQVGVSKSVLRRLSVQLDD